MIHPLIRLLPKINEGIHVADFQKKPGVEDLTYLCSRLVKALDKSVGRNLTDGIMLSGLDTSILAYLASKRVKQKAFTVAFRGVPAPDITYAKLVADRLKLTHSIHHFGEDELYEAIRAVVKTMDSFDPMEIRNSITIYIGLKKAKENGINSVMTGDGCDELFAGYSFLHGLEKEQLGLELQKLWSFMHFSSMYLAKVLGIEVKLPYLDPEFKRFAMELDPGLKIRSERGQTWGKWILRKAFENILSEEIVWRAKVPIESGSGTATLPKFFDSTISEIEFDEKKSKYLDEDKVTIRDKEQLFYYEIYRSAVGVPHPTDPRGKVCPFCNSNMPVTSTYCRKCGAYPI